MEEQIKIVTKCVHAWRASEVYTDGLNQRISTIAEKMKSFYFKINFLFDDIMGKCREIDKLYAEFFELKQNPS